MKLPRTKQKTKKNLRFLDLLFFFKIFESIRRSMYAEVTIAVVISGKCIDRASATCAPEAKANSAMVPKS
jgi:hypothetical protein